MIHNDSDKAQAVMFIGKEGVVKELLYPEFQAILDGFVPLEEWSERTARAVYLEVNSDLCATAAVFFTVSFDADGAVERSWNLPLMDLARTAAKGPDMGAGPIHLVCASQSPVELFKDYLWDPDLKPSSSHLHQIKKALKQNRMVLQFKQSSKTAEFGELPGDVSEKFQQLSRKLGEQYQKELRDHVAQLLKDQRLQISTMTSEKEAAVKEVRLEYLKKIESLQEQLEQKSDQLSDLQKRNMELKDTIEGQVQKIEGLREYFEKKLERAQGSDDTLVDSMKKQFEAEMEARVASAAQKNADLMKMKEVELIYRKEHEEALQKELEVLRNENQELVENGGDHVLEMLSKKGVNFVTYQPGAGHITIPLSQIQLFLESPIAFTAGYCGISEKHYNSWLEHYQAPVCKAVEETGQMCGLNIERVTNPAQFVDGESNYCAKHNKLNAPGNRSVKRQQN